MLKNSVGFLVSWWKQKVQTYNLSNNLPGGKKGL